MKVMIDITDEEYNECKNRYDMIFQEGYLNYNLNTALVFYIANGTPLEEKTNGDVIKALFPNIETFKPNKNEIAIKQELGWIAFKESWWNSLYKEIGQ